MVLGSNIGNTSTIGCTVVLILRGWSRKTSGRLKVCFLLRGLLGSRYKCSTGLNCNLFFCFITRHLMTWTLFPNQRYCRIMSPWLIMSKIRTQCRAGLWLLLSRRPKLLQEAGKGSPWGGSQLAPQKKDSHLEAMVAQNPKDFLLPT